MSGQRWLQRLADWTGRAEDALLVVLLSLPVIALHFVAGPLLGMLGEPPDATAVAHDYTVVRSLAVLPFGAMMLLRQLLQATGKMWPGLAAAPARCPSSTTSPATAPG